MKEGRRSLIQGGSKGWRAWIKDLPIRRKMAAALVMWVILPILLLGVLTTTRIVRLGEQNQYEVQINQLIKSAKDIEGLYETVTREAAALAGDRAVQAVAGGGASVIDYKSAAKQMLEAGEKIDSCSSIALIKDGQVLFQRGPLYLGERENTTYTSQIEKGERMYLWAPEHPVAFERGINQTVSNQITYYTTIMKGVTLENQGVLCVHVSAGDFVNRFVPFSRKDPMSNTFIFDSEGNGMVSYQKNHELQTLCWNEFQERGSDKGAGFFPIKTGNGVYMALYARCGGSGWYLFQVEKKAALYSDQILFVAAAVLLCVVFGIVYGMIQNRTIIRPLRRLSSRIDAVKGGVLEKKEYEAAHDEIGNVERGFEDMVVHIHDLIDQVYVQTIKTQDAEREMLLAKMNPHFLYNALDSIHWLAIRNKDYEVSEQLEALADVYRHILRFGEDMIAVGEEVEFMDNYLFLLELQMGDRVEFFRDIPEELYDFPIPKLIIQPLVENAVQHGLRDAGPGGKVKIRMRRRGNLLKILVLDNGVGCDAARLNQVMRRKDTSEAFALRNIDERIRLRCGDDYGLKLYSRTGWGTMALVALRLEEPCGCSPEEDEEAVR